MKKKTLGNICKAGLKALACATLAVSLAASNFVGLYPKAEVYAVNPVKNLQIGSAVLTPVMTDVEDTTYRPSNIKERVTTAQTVYYGLNGTDKWLVIGYNGSGAVSEWNTATLFAFDNIETGKAYRTTEYSNSYEESDIRKILIGESNENGEGGYYNSRFTSVEKGAITARFLAGGASYRDDVDNLCDGISGPSLRADKLWLLSTKEADLLKPDYRTTSDIWWLRSPGSLDNRAASVSNGSNVHFAGSNVADSNGVRPAFNLNLQSIIFTSAATGGKSSGNLGADALREVDAYSGNEWKLTLLDDGSINSAGDGHSSFSAVRTDSDTIVAGGTVEISYSGAKTGTGEYVSAIITDASDTVLYYGNIASCTSTSGTASINIPNDFAAGNKLYVFQEKCNGNNMTDYSSALINLTAPASSSSVPSSNSRGGEVDYFADLKNAFDYAIALGVNQTVTWSTDCVLTYDIMKLLAEHPSITLAFSYTYEDVDYKVTIPGRLAKPDPTIPIYGPLYLYGMYGGTAKKH